MNFCRLCAVMPTPGWKLSLYLLLLRGLHYSLCNYLDFGHGFAQFFLTLGSCSLKDGWPAPLYNILYFPSDSHCSICELSALSRRNFRRIYLAAGPLADRRCYLLYICFGTNYGRCIYQHSCCPLDSLRVSVMRTLDNCCIVLPGVAKRYQLIMLDLVLWILSTSLVLW